MKREFSIKKQSEIDLVYQKKNVVSCKGFSLFVMKNDVNLHFRYALSIGKKYGNSVERNLMKRRVREVVHSLSLVIDSSYDFLIVIKPLSKEYSFETISAELKYLMSKIKLIKEVRN